MKLDVFPEFVDDGAAAVDGVEGAAVCFVDDGGDEVLAKLRAQIDEVVFDVVDGEKSADVEELRHHPRRKVGCPNAVQGAVSVPHNAAGAWRRHPQPRRWRAVEHVQVSWITHGGLK